MTWRERAEADLAETNLPPSLVAGILAVAHDADEAYEIACGWLIEMRAYEERERW